MKIQNKLWIEQPSSSQWVGMVIPQKLKSEVGQVWKVSHAHILKTKAIIKICIQWNTN